MSAHLTLDGAWAECLDETVCSSPVHVELSVKEAEALPDAFIELLAEAADPPHGSNSINLKYWLDGDGLLHRGYGLPSSIGVDGTRIYQVHGERHRDHGRPAVTFADGRGDWWEHGKWIRGATRGLALDEAWQLSQWVLQGLTTPRSSRLQLIFEPDPTPDDGTPA